MSGFERQLVVGKDILIVNLLGLVERPSEYCHIVTKPVSMMAYPITIRLARHKPLVNLPKYHLRHNPRSIWAYRYTGCLPVT